MGASNTRLSVSQHTTAEAFKRDQMLLRAMYKAQRVLHNDKYDFVRVMRTEMSGGDVETTVYLSGSPDPVMASAITLAPDVDGI